MTGVRTTVSTLAGDEDYCSITDACDMQVDQGTGESWCVCTLQGFFIDNPPSEPPPAWPDPPGWAPPPESGGAPPGGGPGGGCDPTQPEGGCEWTATLECNAGVVRGQTGSCYFAVDPPSALEAIHGWTFRSSDPDLVVGGQQNPPPATWAGAFVATGQVRVDFRAGGADAIATTYLQVARRSDSQWRQTLSGSIHYSSGTLTFPAGYGDSYMAVLCHHVTGCPSPPGAGGPQHYLVQPQQPQHGLGYTHAQVADGGPNSGLFYVESASSNIGMASGANPDYLSGGALRPQACAGASEISFWDFNHHPECGAGGAVWGGQWLSWLFAGHEDIHAQKGVAFIAAKPEFDARYLLEEAVRQDAEQLRVEAVSIMALAGTCFGWAARVHGNSMGGTAHPIPDFDIWFWQSGSGFWKWQPASGAWWLPDEEDPEIVIDPDCL